MSQVLALITQDAAMVRCELDRVRAGFSPGPGEVVGVGSWQEGHVVQRQYGAGVPLGDAWEAADSEIVVLASRALGVGQDVERSAQPFRFRQWLFAATGVLERGEAVRERLWEELPEFLQQGAVRGPTWEEAAFARFLAELRELGRMEDPGLDGPTAAAALSACARAIEQVSGGVGVAARPRFSLVAGNGRVVVATSRGAPLSYALLEGRTECARHELGPDAREGDALVRDHRRRRSVVLAAAAVEGWVRLPEGATIAVDRKLAVTIK